MFRFNQVEKKSAKPNSARATCRARYGASEVMRLNERHVQSGVTQRDNVALKRPGWIWLVIFVSAVPYAALGATLTVPAGSGDHFWADASGSLAETWNNAATSDSSTYGFRWNIATQTQGANICNKSDDKGYMAQTGVIRAGVKITQGVIMHFTAGSLTNTISGTNSSNTPSTGSATLASNGTMINLVNSRAEGNQVLCTAMPAGNNSRQGASISTRLTGGKVSIYVDDTAQPGTYTIPPLYLAVDIGGAATRLITSAGTLVIQPRPSCTVKTLDKVAFGAVAPQSVKGTGIAVSTSLDIACTNPSSIKTDVSWSVKPKTQAGDKFTLPMVSTAGGIAGDIRGFIGSTATTDAGCADKNSSVRMDNTTMLLRSSNKTESWSNPLTWVLCPRANASPGEAKAIATIELNW